MTNSIPTAEQANSLPQFTMSLLLECLSIPFSIHTDVLFMSGMAADKKTA